MVLEQLQPLVDLVHARKRSRVERLLTLTVADLQVEVLSGAAQLQITIDREASARYGLNVADVRELVETAISGRDTAVPAEDRDYVKAVQAADGAAEKIRIYAAAVTAIQHRLAPVFVALRDAATTDRGCADLWAEIAERRARNMRLFAAELRRTGQLRTDLSDSEVADVIWSMNAAEYWQLLVQQRGWTPERFRDWLIDAWSRLLLNRNHESGG